MIDEKLLEETIDDVVTTSGFSLVDLKINSTRNRSTVRVYMYRPEGVGVDDCARISRELEEVISNLNIFPSRYTIEVSSPGAERVLKSKEEFDVFIGRAVKVEYSGDDGGISTVIGSIIGTNGDSLKLDTEDGGEVTIPLGSIRKARLYLDWNRVVKRSPDGF